MTTTSHFDLVVIGGGMAAARLLKTLAANGYSRSVLVISEEPCAGYNRVLLPDLLAGRCIRSDLMPLAAGARISGYQRRLNTRVVALDVKRKVARCADGTQVYWDKAILAIGSRVATPDVLAVDCARVQALRTLADVESLQRLPSSVERITVVGGGLLGLEAAHALKSLGYAVTVVHRNAALMNHQLDPEASAHLLATLQEKDLDFRLGVQVGGLEADANSIHGVTLSDGTNLLTDLVLVATGNTPNTELAVAAGLNAEHGILVNDQLQTSAPNIWAVGECAQHKGEVHAFVEPVYAQADWLAQHLCGGEGSLTLPKPNARLKVAGVELFCAGRVAQSKDSQSLVVRQTAQGIYRRLEFNKNKLTGAVLLGDAVGSQAILAALGTEVTAGVERENLAFGARCN